MEQLNLPNYERLMALVSGPEKSTWSMVHSWWRSENGRYGQLSSQSSCYLPFHVEDEASINECERRRWSGGTFWGTEGLGDRVLQYSVFELGR
jgi:hypothetical protein